MVYSFLSQALRKAFLFPANARQSVYASGACDKELETNRLAGFCVGGNMFFKKAQERVCTKCGGYVFTTARPEDAVCDDCNGSHSTKTTNVKHYQKESISESLRWEVYERDNFTCKKCGSRRNLTVDHIYPEALGGKATLENCQTLCRKCNSSKGKRL